MTSPGELGPSKLPAFSPDAASIRDSEWSLATDAKDSEVVVVDSLEKTFGLEELLHERRNRTITLQLDPSAYLFSYIKTFSDRPECVLPDRAVITYSTHCLRSYARHVLDIAARRQATVIGAPTAEVDLFLAGDERVVAEDLLQVPRGRITEQGLRDNIRVVLCDVAELSAGQAAQHSTSDIELSRAQLWQWVHHETGVLDTGRIITPALFDAWLGEECAALDTEQSGNPADAAHLEQAARLLGDLTRTAALAPSIVDEAYRLGE